MTEQSKEKTKTTTAKGRKLSFGFMAVVLLLIGITASFWHKPIPNKNPIDKIITKDRSALKKYWNAKEAAHDSLHENGLISKAEYFRIKRENEKERVSDFKGISKRRKIAALDFSFNGRSNANFWWWVFGTHLTLLIVSCYLAIKDNRLKKVGLLKWYEPHAAISFIAVSLFWMYHTIFMTSKDFPLSIYTLYLVLVVIPVSYFIYHTLRRITVIDEKHLETIRLLITHGLKYTRKDKEDELWQILDKAQKNGR